MEEDFGICKFELKALFGKQGLCQAIGSDKTCAYEKTFWNGSTINIEVGINKNPAVYLLGQDKANSAPAD